MKSIMYFMSTEEYEKFLQIKESKSNEYSESVFFVNIIHLWSFKNLSNYDRYKPECFYK